jgi:uncharacterized Ntn-hydrolase superfamily protein
MTLTILGRCPQTGQLGGTVTTADVAVGARVLFAQPGLAVVATQHRTDPRLGPALLDELQAGLGPVRAVAAVADATPHRAWRQLGVLNAAGRSGAYSGELLWPIGAELAGENCLVLGNVLSNDRVAPAMVDAFESGPPELADRLLAAVRAGERAGGEAGELRSAALLVVERESFPLIDLRVDDDPNPLGRLEALWEVYRPLVRVFVARALDPGNVQRSSSTTT